MIEYILIGLVILAFFVGLSILKPSRRPIREFEQLTVENSRYCRKCHLRHPNGQECPNREWSE